MTRSIKWKLGLAVVLTPLAVAAAAQPAGRSDPPRQQMQGMPMRSMSGMPANQMMSSPAMRADMETMMRSCMRMMRMMRNTRAEQRPNG